MNSTPNLNRMIDRLDNRSPGEAGYVTPIVEVQQILNELSPLVTASITEDLRRNPDEVSVTVRIGFTLSRSELNQ
jgi:hypothetical protein